MTTTRSTPTAPDTVDAATVSTGCRPPRRRDDHRRPDAGRVRDHAHPGLPTTSRSTSLGEHAAQFAARLDRKVVLVCQSGARASQARLRLAGVGAPAPAHPRRRRARVRRRRRRRRAWARPAGPWTARSASRPGRSSSPASWPASPVPRRTASLAGGIGAGLTLAALTDSCAMSKVLGLLPYNKGPADRTVHEVLGELPAQRFAA